MTDIRRMHPATRIIHAGQHPDPATGAVSTPIYQTSTFAFRNADEGAARFQGRDPGYKYTRLGNPTVAALEECLATLEGGCGALGAATGMAAINTVYVALLEQGAHVVGTDSVYGPSRLVLENEYRRFGVASTWVDSSNPENVAAAMRPSTKMVYIESPANPTMKLTDIAACADIAHGRGALLVVDNTFASPYLQQPLLLGADVVLHSTTKYIGGHSDVVGGALITNDEEFHSGFGFLQNGAGAVPGPFDAFLTLRGAKTLALRMEKHCDNAEAIVDLLQGHKSISKVFYPGLADHPGHAAAAKQMRRYGGMISVLVEGGREAALDFCSGTSIFTLAESLGGVESLIEHPGAMTHASTAGSPLEVPDNLVRLSVGIEDAADLIADIEQALS